MKKKINIFISSPGDVRQERYIANQIISEISNIFYEYVDVNCLMWEKMALPSTGTFQEGIEYITNQYHIDIAVFILWSRLGSNPGRNFLKEDGSEYSSGTEYEYDMMKALHAKSGDPKILFYVKQAPFKDAISSLNSDSEMREAIKQYDLLKQFITKEFKEEGSSASKAYSQFSNAQEFRGLITAHLKDLVKRIVGERYNVVKEWKDNPYVGLNSFTYEYRDVFYGRTNFVNQIASDLIRESDAGRNPSMILLGESGSGKSSLINAGLFPFLKEGFNEKQSFNIISFVPSLYSGKPYNGFIKILLDCFPEISDNPAFKEIQEDVSENHNFSYLTYALTHSIKRAVPLVFFDQFEELFSDPQVTEDERIRFLTLLLGIVRSNSMWVIISMRNDFYSKFATYPQMSEIKKSSLFYDVPNLTISEVSQIVNEPARKAGIKWEIDSNGVNLEKIIINEAVVLKDLPLIEFGLYELYQLKDENDFISIESYENIGRLKGAIIKHADAFYNELSEEEKKAFNELLSSVITKTSDSSNVFARKTAFRSDVETDATHRALIDKLIAAHIFKSGKDSEGHAIVTIVHEILLSFWPVIENWCSSQKDFIGMNDFYESQSQYWKDAGKPKNKLLTDGEDVLNAEYFLYSWGQYASLEAKEYVKTSIACYRKRKLGFWIFLDAILVLFFIYSIWATFGPDSTFSKYPVENIFSLLSDIPLYLAIYFIVRSRIKGAPLYESSAKIMVLFGITSVLYCINYILLSIPNHDSETLWLMGILLALIISAFVCSYINYNIPRKIWKRENIEGIRRYHKKACNTKKLAKFGVVAILTVIISFLLYASSSSKNAKIDTLSQYSDAAFEVIHSLRDNGQLTREQNQALLEFEKGFIEEVYDSEISQTDSCSKRKLDYALCLFRMNQTDSAIEKLEETLPESYEGRLYYAYFNAEMGRIDKVKSFLTYDATNQLDSLGQLSLTRIHWAECFDLLERAREELSVAQTYSTEAEDNNTLRLLTAKANLEFLESGNSEHLIRKYSEILTKWSQCETDISDMSSYLFGKFSDIIWYNDIPLAQQNEVLSFLNKDKIDFCSSQSDSILTHTLRPKLEGQWARSEQADVLTVEIGLQIFHQYNALRRRVDYRYNEESESQTAIYQYRIFEHDKQLYMDRYCSDQTSRVILAIEIEDDKLIFRPVYPNSAADEGIVVYERVADLQATL